jgi:hypothetical protein
MSLFVTINPIKTPTICGLHDVCETIVETNICADRSPSNKICRCLEDIGNHAYPRSMTLPDNLHLAIPQIRDGQDKSRSQIDCQRRDNQSENKFLHNANVA